MLHGADNEQEADAPGTTQLGARRSRICGWVAAMLAFCSAKMVFALRVMRAYKSMTWC